MELAQQTADQGLLDAGEPGLASGVEPAAAWAGFAFAVARSELNPAEGVRLGGKGREAPANPLVRYLREELSKARQRSTLKHYGEWVKHYLDAFNDYLRY